MINVPQILWMYIVHAVCDSNQLEKGERNRKKEDENRLWEEFSEKSEWT